jgi:hypothetical protein
VYLRLLGYSFKNPEKKILMTSDSTTIYQKAPLALEYIYVILRGWYVGHAGEDGFVTRRSLIVLSFQRLIVFI